MQNGYILDLENWAKSLTEVELGKYWTRGTLLRKSVPDITTETINRYKKINGHLNASSILDDLFKEYDADIFLSHSHKDSRNVMLFAGYLRELGFLPFVDSFVWGSADDLLRKINNTYSRIDGKLNYDEVLRTSPKVYMILNVALINMINRTDKFILLETPQTIQRGNTQSPWIYSELLYSKMFCPTQPICEHTDIDYPVYTAHLEKLPVNEIERVLCGPALL